MRMETDDHLWSGDHPRVVTMLVMAMTALEW
jgi:hypothetical protein